MSPPVFGDHYPTWAAFQTYEYPVPLGYLVHSLEHGAVVVFYDCPEGCAEEVAEGDLPLGPDEKVGGVLAEGLVDKGIGENAVHGSDSDENAAIEISYFFSKLELV